MVNRILTFVCAVALGTAPPAVALAAHPMVFAPPRMAAPMPRAIPRAGSTFTIQPKPFSGSLHPALRIPTAYGLRPLLSPAHWYGLQFRPNYLWYPVLYPTLYSPACYAHNSFSNSPSDQQSTNMTLGSLVDGKANILNPQSFNSGFAAKDTTTQTSPFALQAGFSTSSCGPGSFSF